MTRRSRAAPFPVVVVAASAGAFDPLYEIVGSLPATLRAAILVVMHLHPGTPSRLPWVLSLRGTLPAAHPRDGERLEPGRIYVAPPDRHLEVARAGIRLTQDPPENYVRPAADVLFRSAARAFGSRTIGIVLSGGGRDGAAGLAAIVARGGLALVQHPAEAETASMPVHALGAARGARPARAAQIGAYLGRLAAAPPGRRTRRAAFAVPRGAAGAGKPRPVRSLRGLRVLVAEDRYLIAAEIARMLGDLGCERVGPVPDVEAGLRLLREDRVPLGCALLDVDLGGETVFPLARELRRRAVPIAFATGYDRAAIPEAFGGYPRVQKPFGARALKETLRLALRTQPPLAPTAEGAGQVLDPLAELLKESRNIVMASRSVFGGVL
jgi:CheY-like chemotaxis protein